MNKFAAVVAGVVSAFTLFAGTVMADSADFQALKDLAQSTLTPLTLAELNGVVGGHTKYHVRYGDKRSSTTYRGNKYHYYYSCQTKASCRKDHGR
jgi:hypothetical protein